jgi:hypothetical protein
MRILPIAAIVCGLTLSAAWTAYLGFEMFRVVDILGRDIVQFAYSDL